MALLSDSNVEHLRALFEMIPEVENHEQPLLDLIHEAINAHDNDKQELNIKHDYNEGLWLARQRAQNPAICTRDWTAA